MTKRTVIQDCLMFFSCCLGLTPNRFQEKYKKTAGKSAVIVKDWFEAQQRFPLSSADIGRNICNGSWIMESDILPDDNQSSAVIQYLMICIESHTAAIS